MSKINGPQMTPPDRSERQRPEPTEIKADLALFQVPIEKLVKEEIRKYRPDFIESFEIDYVEQASTVHTDGSLILGFDIITPKPRLIQPAVCNGNNDTHEVSRLKLIGEPYLPFNSVDTIPAEIAKRFEAARKLSSQRETPKPID